MPRPEHNRLPEPPPDLAQELVDLVHDAAAERVQAERGEQWRRTHRPRARLDDER